MQTDHFLESTNANGPLISRLAMSGALESPMFTVQFQRGALDKSGHGALTIGKLPDGIDNSSLTWVPVRRYGSHEGGLHAPSFAPEEVRVLPPIISDKALIKSSILLGLSLVRFRSKPYRSIIDLLF